MIYLRVLRVLAALGGTIYAVMMFIAAKNGDRFSLTLYTSVAGVYFFGAGKAHSAVNSGRQRRRRR